MNLSLNFLWNQTPKARVRKACAFESDNSDKSAIFAATDGTVQLSRPESILKSKKSQGQEESVAKNFIYGSIGRM